MNEREQASNSHIRWTVSSEGLLLVCSLSFIPAAAERPVEPSPDD